ncbi:MAG TPA: 2Fe-2S iron-sulfur cluster-binding protein, partial [Candidatus Limnocylindrales bacterium]|nr:2Fe-2S iron-sulfur cluster-binding protein [Candidatus Limnocylindrales bacterium]
MSDRRIVVDRHPIPFEPGDSLAVAIVRASGVPGDGGALCLAGDCGNCLAEVDRVAYVRTCQVEAQPGTVVTRHPATVKPQLPSVDWGDLTVTPVSEEVAVRRVETDVVVIGGGPAGTAAAESTRADGREVVVLDAGAGSEAVAIYPGPAVVARDRAGMVHVHAEEIVVATGAAEIQPACPGSRLAGIVTARAAERLVAAG